MRLAGAFFVLTCAGSAQKHEIGLTLGNLGGPTRPSPGGALDLDRGVALQANYGYCVMRAGHFSLAAEVHLLANGQRRIFSSNAAGTRDVATLYVTPGVRLKVAAPLISPYAVVGAGYALYEQSHFTIYATPNPAPRFIHRGAFVFGGGADAPVWRWVGLRGEVRDFYTGNPAFNAPVAGGQHNVVVGGGLVLSFGARN